MPRQFWTRLRDVVLVALVCAGVTLLALPARDRLDHANTVMLFMLAVLLLAWRLGRGPALLAAVLSVVCFDVFFIPPYFSLTVFDPQYLVTFGVMLSVGLLISHLTAGVRAQANLALARERESRELYEVARTLAGAATREQIEDILSRYLQQLDCQGSLYLRSDQGDLVGVERTSLNGRLLYLALDEARILEVDPRSGLDMTGIILPLFTPMSIRGVLLVQAARPEILQAGHSRLAALASLLAIAIERLHYVEVAQRTLLNMNAERLRNSILSSLSHDLRTPLTSMVGLADALALSQELPSSMRETSAVLCSQARYMNHLLENLLDMARLQSGKVTLRREWQLFEDAISGCVHQLQPILGKRDIRIHLQPDLPLVAFDALLFERVLFNLIENAAKYAPAEQPIEIEAYVQQDLACIEIRDHGPGFPDAMLEKVFQPFVRGEVESAKPGVGLGLAICRTIVEAHGGSITARNLPEGGAGVVVCLPLGQPPKVEMEPGEVL